MADFPESNLLVFGTFLKLLRVLILVFLRLLRTLPKLFPLTEDEEFLAAIELLFFGFELVEEDADEFDVDFDVVAAISI